MKILVTLLVAGFAWWLLRGLFRNLARGEPPPTGAADAPPPESPTEALAQESMVACAFCQLHLPRSEALWSGEKAFCGKAHLQAHESEPPGR
jgi:uncharacterized protein